MSSQAVAFADLNSSHIHRYICMWPDAQPGVTGGPVAGLIVGVQHGHDGAAVTIAVGKGRTVTVTAFSGGVHVGDAFIDVLHRSIAVDNHPASGSAGKLPAGQARRRVGRHLCAVPQTSSAHTTSVARCS
jgi:hypothetical protein